MTDWNDETLRSLDDLARIAFPDGSGVTAKTLKGRARQGKLTVYRPGRAYLSTLANVRTMIEATRAQPSSKPKETPAVPNALGLTETELASLALDEMLRGSLKERAGQRESQREARKANRAARSRR